MFTARPARSIQGSPFSHLEGLFSTPGASILLTQFLTNPDGKINLNGWTDSRAASLWLPDHEGIIREVPPGTPALVDPVTGSMPRVVHNILWDAQDMTTAKWAKQYGAVAPDSRTLNFPSAISDAWGDYSTATSNIGSSFRVKGKRLVARLLLSGNPGETIEFALDCSGGSGGQEHDNYRTIVLTSTPTWYSIDTYISNPGSWGPTLYLSRKIASTASVVYVDGVQVEESTGKTDFYIPSEFITDEFAYYATDNYNTVDANGVVTEAVGSNLSSYGEWGFAHYPGTTNYVKWSDDLTNWTTRTGTSLTVTYTGGKSELRSLGAVGVDDIYALLGGFTANATVAAQFQLWPVSSTGTLTCKNPYTNTLGQWSIDLSLVSSGDVITKDHPAVTEVYPFVANSSGNSGLHFYSSGGATIDVDIANCQLEDGRTFTTPVVKTTGSTASRDICGIQHDYTGYFNQDEGVLVFDWVPLHDAYVRSIAQPLFTLNPSTTTGPAYIGTVNLGKFNATDGINYASVIPPTTYVDGDLARVATRWSVGSNELQTGLLNSGNLDGWKWGSLKNYNGAFVVSGDTIFLFNGMPEIGICKSLAIYNKDMTTAEIEALP